MAGFVAWDIVALIGFVCAWLGYHVAVERGPHADDSLNAHMNRRRHVWFRQAAQRENRIVDTQVMNGLQNGTAFFASTSLVAIGGSTALLGATDQVLQMFAELPFSGATTRTMWELKVIGLAVIFAYAFFKFAWSYRLFNYGAILLGSVPPLGRDGVPSDRAAFDVAVREAAEMNVVAGRHFNRGQRAFFFALAYLGWFLGPQVLFVFTLAVLVVMWRRQFHSDSWAVVSGRGRG